MESEEVLDETSKPPEDLDETGNREELIWYRLLWYISPKAQCDIISAQEAYLRGTIHSSHLPNSSRGTNYLQIHHLALSTQPDPLLTSWAHQNFEQWNHLAWALVVALSYMTISWNYLMSIHLHHSSIPSSDSGSTYELRSILIQALASLHCATPLSLGAPCCSFPPRCSNVSCPPKFLPLFYKPTIRACRRLYLWFRKYFLGRNCRSRRIDFENWISFNSNLDREGNYFQVALMTTKVNLLSGHG